MSKRGDTGGGAAGDRAGEIVRRARRQAGLTQAELAARIGTTQSAVSRLEAGGVEPSLARLDLIVEACGAKLAVTLDGGRPIPREADDVYQQRWADAIRMANFVIEGRRSMRSAAT